MNPARETPVLELDDGALLTQEAHLRTRPHLVGDSCSVADLSTFAYTHVAADAGLDLSEYPAVSVWLERVTALPGFIDDLVPYPDNARAGASRSIYDDGSGVLVAETFHVQPRGRYSDSPRRLGNHRRERLGTADEDVSLAEIGDVGPQGVGAEGHAIA